MAGPEEVLSFGEGPNRPDPDRRVVRRRLIAAIAVPVLLVAGLGLYLANEERRGTEGSPYSPWMSRYDASMKEFRPALDDTRIPDATTFDAACKSFITVADDGARLPPTGNGEADSVFGQAMRSVKEAARMCRVEWEDKDRIESFALESANATAWLDAFRKLNGT